MKHKIYTNQTVNFPATSKKDHKYLMIMWELYGNVILAEPMKNKTEKEMIRTYQTLINRLKECGINTTRHILDNGTSDAYKERIKGNEIQYELAP